MKEPLLIRKMRVLGRKELLLFRKEMRKLNLHEDLMKVAIDIVELLTSSGSADLISFDRIFRNSTFGLSKQNVLLNKLHEHVKFFIIRRLALKDLQAEIHEEILLLKFFNGRWADEFVRASVAKVEELLRSYAYEDNFYFYSNLRLAEERTLLHYRSSKEKRDLQIQSDAVDLFYLSKKLVFCSGMVNAANINKSEYDYHMMEEVLSHLEKKPYENVPTIYLWASALRLLIDPSDRKNFDDLESGLYENVDLIAPLTARNLFTALENSLRKMKGDFTDYHQKLFEFYQFQIEKNIIYIKGYFPSTLFENIVTVSLEVKGADWTMNFIKEHLKNVSPEQRRESKAHNFARCYFYEGNFRKCVDQLKTIEKMQFSSIHLNLSRRRLRIQALYEIYVAEVVGIQHQPERAIRALKKFLHTNKKELGEVHERANLDFARFVNRLTEVHGEKKVQRLKSEIEATTLLPEKQWLLEKVATV